MRYELKYNKDSCDKIPVNLNDLFAARGFTGEKLKRLTHPNYINNYLDPTLLDHIDAGCDLLRKHIAAEHPIDLLVDCDCDGYTSAAQMYLFIKKLNPNIQIRYYIHEGKQHGLEDQMNKLRDIDDLYCLIIPDASSNDYDFHEELRNAGVDILVLDHHEAEYYSPNAIVINNQLSKIYPNKGLSGATIVYKFINYYCIDMDDDIKDFAFNLIDLAALGAIGDMMDVSDLENRYLFKTGLANVNNFGFRVLVEKQAYSLGDTTRLSPIGIAFYIVPLINALIRVGSMNDKELLFRNFIEGDTLVQSTKRGAKPGQMETIAEQNARNCINAKSRQKRAEDNALDYLSMIIERDNLTDNKILIIDVDDPSKVDSTITGLIAMKVMNVYHRPVLLGRTNSDGELKGSIRNDDKSELKDLRQFLLDSNLCTYVQGHANAAGFGINRSNVDKLNEYANEKLKDIDFNEGVYSVDFIFNEDEDCLDLLFSDIDYYHDLYGQGFNEPLIVIEDIPVNCRDIQVMGKTADTIKFSHNGVEYIQFHAKDFLKSIDGKDNITITVLGRASINRFMGKETPQLIITDYNIRDSIFDF
jgi:single-stranded-DNA-specific exonuclease